MSIEQRKEDQFTLPTLYELSDSGKIKVWAIGVNRLNNKASCIYVNYGWKDGVIQEQTDVVESGKNIGKVNQTTSFEQACSEAKSKWEGKKKKGYVESLDDAKIGKVDSIITGGIEPMLAHVYSKVGDRIVYPAYVQPKLDGHRCIAIKVGDNVTLWSRTRKPILSCPHIEKAIAKQFAGQNVILDGELYNHDYHDNFEVVSSAIRQSKPTDKSGLIHYHIYDIVNKKKFNMRNLNLPEYFELPLVKVITIAVRNEKVMWKYFDEFTGMGYEGLMLRNANGCYENKRSYHLQKVKEFEDAEFEIVGVNEGRGKLQGKLGTFTCVTKEGNKFEVKMTGDENENTQYLKNKRLWEGKMLTVKFQKYTKKNSVPRFPVGIRIKEYI